MRDLIDRAEALTALQIAARRHAASYRRYPVASETLGEGRVVLSDNLISVDDAMNAIREVPSVELSEAADACDYRKVDKIIAKAFDDAQMDIPFLSSSSGEEIIRDVIENNKPYIWYSPEIFGTSGILIHYGYSEDDFRSSKYVEPLTYDQLIDIGKRIAMEVQERGSKCQ